MKPGSSDSVINRTVAVSVARPGADQITGFGFLALVSHQIGYFVSVAHLFNGVSIDSTVRLRFKPDGIVKDAIVASVKAVDRGHDLALLQAALPYGFSDYDELQTPSVPTVYRGQEVWFVGRFGDWYVPVEPGLVNQVGDDGLVSIDRFDVQPGSSGAPVFSSIGFAGLVTDRITTQSARAVGILPILNFLLANHVSVDPDAPLMRAMRYLRGQNFAKAFVERKRKESQARSTRSGPDSGDLAGDFALGDVMLTQGEQFGHSDETLFFDWSSEGDGGGNHSESYVTTVPLRNEGKSLPTVHSVTTQTGQSHVGFFGVDYASTVCTRDQSRISLKGCLSDGTTADCSTQARKAYLRCSNNRLIELGAMKIASSEPDLVDELGNKSADQAIQRGLGVEFERWSYPLDKVADLPPSLRDSFLQYRGYPAATELSGFKVRAIVDADVAKFWGLSEGTVLLQADNLGQGVFPGLSLEGLACLVDLPDQEDGKPLPTVTFHLLLPSASSVSVVQVPLYKQPKIASTDPIQGTRFSIWGVDSRISAAEAIKNQLTMRGATFLERQRWQMLATCDVTTSPGDAALSSAVSDLAEKVGLGKLGQWTDSTLQKGQFVLSIGSKCLQQ